MRNVHRILILGVSLCTSTLALAQAATEPGAQPCYGSLSPAPTPLSTAGEATPSLTAPNTPVVGTPSPTAASVASGGCRTATAAPPPAPSPPPPTPTTEPNTLGGVPVQSSNPNATIGGLPTSAP
jgi:hypothetical protein